MERRRRSLAAAKSNRKMFWHELPPPPQSLSLALSLSLSLSSSRVRGEMNDGIDSFRGGAAREKRWGSQSTQHIGLNCKQALKKGGGKTYLLSLCTS